MFLQSVTWITQMNKGQKWRLTFAGPRFMTLMTSQSRGKGQPFQQMELGQLNIHRGEKKNGHPTALCVQNSIPGELQMSVWKTTLLDKIWETFLGPTVREGFVNAQKVQTTRGNDLSNCTKLRFMFIRSYKLEKDTCSTHNKGHIYRISKTLTN